MAWALVVDDSHEDRERAGRILEESGLHVDFAVDGQLALEAIEARRPDIVVTDVMMPGLDGLQLIDAIHQRHLPVPVVVMTSRGSEDVAAAALLKGAASYVPKQFLEQDLADTVRRVIEVTKEKQDEARAFGCLAETSYRFVLDSDPDRFRSLIAFLRRQMARRGLGDETALMQVAVALDEALANAIHHGNLGISSDLRERDLELYFKEIEKRRGEPPYADRRATVIVSMDGGEATFVIRDEGEGFDPAAVPDPTAPENLKKASGRGLLLIRTVMDEVRHNEKGNEITMVKRVNR